MANMTSNKSDISGGTSLVQTSSPTAAGTQARDKATEIALTLKRGDATMDQKVPAIGRSAFFKMSAEEKK